MEPLIDKLSDILDLVIISGLLWAGGRITHGLSSMRKLAKETWQKALTETLVGFVAFIGFISVILFVV